MASLLPMHSRQDVDNAKHQVYHFQDKNNYDSAHLVVDHAIKSAEAIDYKYGLAKSMFIKSYLYKSENKLGESFTLNLKALKLLNQLSDDRVPKTIVDVYINTGKILQQHFKYDDAARYYLLGLDIANKHELKVRTHELLYSLGQVERRQGNIASARSFIEQSLQLSIQTEDEWTILNSYNLLGLVETDFGDFEKAREYFQAILSYDIEEEDIFSYTGMAHINIAETYLIEGANAFAFEEILKSLSAYRLSQNSPQMFDAELLLTTFYSDNGDLKNAIEIGLMAEKSYSSTNKNPEQYKIFELLTHIAFEAQDYQMARSYHLKYLEQNENFLKSQSEILQNSEQYKMELLSANFFKDIDKQEQLAQLNHIIYLLLGFGLLSLVFVRAKKYLFKKSLEQAFREVTHRTNFRF